MKENNCRACGNKLILREVPRKPSQLKQVYYYTAYYFCPKCQMIYYHDKFKVINDNQEPKKGFWTSQKQGDSKEDSGTVDVEIWTDGACVSNGRPNARAAWAFVSGKTEKAGLVRGVKQTNNVAEGLAVFYALEWAARNKFKKIKIYTDSQITLYGVKKSAHRVKQNREIFQDIEDIIKKYGLQVFYEKVLGHSDDVNNSRADRLANGLAADRLDIKFI